MSESSLFTGLCMPSGCPVYGLRCELVAVLIESGVSRVGTSIDMKSLKADEKPPSWKLDSVLADICSIVLGVKLVA